MTTQTIDELLRENEDLSRRLEEAEEALRALRAGEVDAVLVESGREQVYTLETPDNPYRLLVAQVPHAAVTLTADGAIISCNHRFADLLQQQPASLRGRQFRDFVAPDSHSALEVLLRDGKTIEARDTVTLLGGDGTPVSAYLGVSALREGALGVCLMVTDLSEQRHYEELQLTQAALRASEERYRTLFESIDEGFCVIQVLFDESGRPSDFQFLETNPSFEHQTGLGEVVGKNMRQLRPELEEHWFRIYGQVATTGEPIRFQNRADALHRWYDVYAFRTGDPRERKVAVLFNDITERKRTEEALRASESRLTSDLAAAQRLQEISCRLIQEGNVEQLYQQILDAAIGIMHSDMASMQTVDEGRDALRLLAWRGFDPEFGKIFEFNGPDTKTSCSVARREGRRVVVPDVETCDFIVGTPASDDHRRMGIRAVQSTPLVSRGGRLLGIISTHWRTPHEPAEGDLRLLDVLARQAADLIERKRAEDALRDADRKKDEFLATLAHELRNPLAPIRNSVQILMAKGPAVPELQWARGVIDRQVQLMARLLEDLLDVSRISRNKLELRKERVDLAAVVDSAVETSRPVIDAGGHDLSVTLPPEPVRLVADAVRLSQVFANLLNNAAKYTDEGGRIWLIAERQGSDVVVSVKDSGIGIARETLPRVFEIFSQAKPALVRSQGGLGIGLSLVKGLVELHGGSIEARSDGLSQGSEFVVRLPLAAEAPVREPARPSEGEQKPATKCRILIVDDNQDSADSLAMLLKLMGNEVGIAYDGEQALEVAAALRPDVTLLDIGMPKLNGYDACRRIRQESWGRDMFLIALTGWGQEEDRRRTQEAGFNQHIVKPVDPHALMSLLASMSLEKEGGLSEHGS